MKFLFADLSLKEDIISFLEKHSNDFPISLNSKVSIPNYVSKVLNKGHIALAMDGDAVVGAVFFYVNDSITKEAWLSTMIVDKNYRRCGVATELLKIFESTAKKNKMNTLLLCVHKGNSSAKKLYCKFGFFHNEKRTANLETNLTFQKNI